MNIVYKRKNTLNNLNQSTDNQPRFKANGASTEKWRLFKPRVTVMNLFKALIDLRPVVIHSLNFEMMLFIYCKIKTR